MEKQLNTPFLPAGIPAPPPPADLINRLLQQAFSPSLRRLERSPEYLDGVRALLRQQLVGKPLTCPHNPGSAEADAFFAGVAEGRSIYAQHLAVAERSHSSDVDAFAGLKGHDYIKARNLAPQIQRIVQTSAHALSATVNKVAE